MENSGGIISTQFYNSPHNVEMTVPSTGTQMEVPQWDFLESVFGSE